MRVSSNGGNLSITGTGFSRRITPTKYFSDIITVTAEWDYALTHGGKLLHDKVTIQIACKENPVYISPERIALSPGEEYKLSYWHEDNNSPYLEYANVYFTGGNSSFSVSRSGLIKAISPGTGYVSVYSNVSSAKNAPSCYVTVVDVEPTGASIKDVSILADQSTDLSVTVSPSNATVKSSQWYVEKGEDVVSISGSQLKGLKPGTATIYCMVNGSVRSNSASVTVIEPKLTSIATDPLDGAIENSVFINPSVTYSHAISEGTEFNSIALIENGNKKEGSVKISGSQVKFIPSKPLNPKTEYLLSIPGNAVKNKWGSPAQSDVVLSFKTGPLEKSTVSMNPLSGSYLTRNDALTLSSYPSDATIYYTLDGTTPNTAGSVYVSYTNLTLPTT
ncbi:MAG: Ig-like domain-containing protein [Muribaculaceae bacterium]|nr:Ig-like domain-containing protein [Muribaculaceae bacterium]